MPNAADYDEDQAVDPNNVADAEYHRLTNTTGNIGESRSRSDDDFNSMTSPDNYGKDGKSGDLSGGRKAGGENKDAGGGAADLAGTGASLAAGAAGGAAGGVAAGLGKLKGILWGTKGRKAATAGGGTVGLTVAAFTVGSMWLSGPFQLMHISQIMQKAHFSTQEDAGDERMGRVYRFLRSGGDVGETRIGYLGSKYKKTMLADMKKIGLVPVYGSATTFKGFTIDTANPESPYRNMSPEQVQEKLRQRGIKKGVQVRGNSVTVTSDGYFAQRKALKTMVKDAGYSKLTTASRVRILGKYGMVSWHPLTKLDAAVNDKLADTYKKWKEGREERYKTGVDSTTVNPNDAHEEGKDSDGNTTRSDASAEDKQAAADAPGDKAKSTGILKNLSTGNKAAIGAAGGIAAAQGIVCSLKGIADNVDEIRYDQVVMPLTRMGMDAVAGGNQAMAGEDIDLQTAGFVAESFTGKDANGKENNWYQAKSIQNEVYGKDAGVEAKESIKGVGEGVPAWLQWTQADALDSICSTAAQLVGGAVSITLGVLSGGIVSTVSGLIVGIAAGPPAMEAAANFLAGEATDVNAKGADWGNSINYGSRLGANAMALQFGGTELSEKEEVALKQDVNEEDQADFASKNLAYQLFNPKDSRSATGKAIDSGALETTNVASLIGSAVRGIGTIAKLPVVALAPSADAAVKSYDYGFKKYGFSESDQSNPLVADPYANADEVAKILDGPSGEEFIERAKTCFGLGIAKASDEDSVERWGVVPAEGRVNIYSKDYDSGKCRDAGNDNWLRVRFFVFDTAIVEGYACFQGDTKSCENDGVVLNSDGASNTGAQFRVGTFNVLGASHNMSNWKERMDKSINVITTNSLDVVGMQEFQPIQRKYFLEQQGSTYDMFPRPSDGLPDSSAVNAIIWNKSKFTLVSSGTMPNLKYFGNAALPAPYVLLRTTDGQEFYMLNTHDPAHNGSDGSKYADMPYNRWQNAVQHAAFVNSLIQKKNVPVFLTGDFNQGYALRDTGNNTYQNNANYLTYCVVAVNGPMNDAYDLAQKRGDGVKGKRAEKCPNPGNDNSVDHIFITEEVEVTNYFKIGPGKNGSDVHDTHIADVVIPGSASGAEDFTVGTYNIKHETVFGGNCKENACAEKRSQKQANIILGKEDNPALDIVGVQEDSVPQHNRFKTMLTGYDYFPSEVPKNQGVAIYWNRSKFILADSGSIKTIDNVSEDFDRPWVALQTASGKKVYVMSVHGPNDDHGDASGRATVARDAYNWAKSIADQADMIVIMGDFNEKLSAGNGYCILTRDSILQNAEDMVNGKNPGTACPDKRTSTIDQIYLSPKKGITATDWKHASRDGVYGTASDHSPTWVTAHFPAPEGEGGVAGGVGKSFIGRDGFPGPANCVSYVKWVLSRHTVGGYKGGSLGNGKDVARNLGSAYGYVVNNTPAVHAVASFGPSMADPTYGHVAMVAQVNKDGSIVVEESNWPSGTIYGTHTVSAGDVGKLTYAHTEKDWK